MDPTVELKLQYKEIDLLIRVLNARVYDTKPSFTESENNAIEGILNKAYLVFRDVPDDPNWVPPNVPFWDEWRVEHGII